MLKGLVSRIDSSASCSSCGHLVKDEYDSTCRKAEVFLFTSNVEDNKILQWFNSIEWKHWAVVIKFEDDSTRVAEAFCGPNDLVQACYTKEPPRKKGEYYKVGEVNTSPALVREYVLSNKLNGESYLAALKNCQSWVREFATFLGHDIQKKMENFNALEKCRPFLAYVAGSSSASINTANRILGSFSPPATAPNS